MSGFSIPLSRLADKYNARLETVVRKVTLDLFTSVVQKSPVDTGRFKGNWNASTGVPNFTTTPSISANRGLQEAQRALQLPVGGITYLSNGLPYARRLENGYSGQAPAGMVRLSVREFQTFVDRAVR